MLTRTNKPFDRRSGSMACMTIGVLGVWVSALAVPVIANEAGGPNLLVACAVCQFIGTLLGGRIPLDALFLVTGCACVAITAFPAAGVVAFSVSFGALFRRYLDCVWEPVRAARFEFCGQVIAACAFVPIAATEVLGNGWAFVLCSAAIMASIVSTAVRADTRDPADAIAPRRILYAYALVCAGIASFSLGGILVISGSASEWSGSQSTVFATATLLMGAAVAAIVSGYDWPTPAVRFRLGCYMCSATAMLSMWARNLDGYLAMSVAFGVGAVRAQSRQPNRARD